MRWRPSVGPCLACVALLATALAPAAARPSEPGERAGRGRFQHVLLLSVDGLHEADLQRWIAANPRSHIPRLARAGVHYTNARTTTPSDSFPACWRW